MGTQANERRLGRGDPTAFRTALEGALDTAEETDTRYSIRKPLQSDDAEQPSHAEPPFPRETGGAQGKRGG